jgi:hypothetical protein
MQSARIGAEELNETVFNLENGVMNLVLDRAVAEVSGWQRKLEASGEEDLLEVAQGLRLLRAELEKGMEGRARLDAQEIGRLLNGLGSRVQAVADKRGTSAGPGVEENLKKLGGMLSNEGSGISSS